MCKCPLSSGFAAAALVAASLLAGLGFAGTAAAQLSAAKPAQHATPPSQNRTWCNDASSTDVQTIAGCSALIKSGRENKHDLVSDYNNRGVAYYRPGL